MSHLNLLAINKAVAIQTAEALLEVALPQIVSNLADAKDASVFRLARGGLVLWYSTEPNAQLGQFLAIEAESVYEQAVGKTVANAQEVLSPLQNANQAYALLSVNFEANPNLEAVNKIAEELSILLYNRQLERLFSQQINVTTEFNTAETLEDVVDILAKTILQAGQFLTVSAFEYDEEGNIRGGRVVTSANRRQVFPSSVPSGLNRAALEIFRERLDANGDMLISDIESEENFTANAKAWLQEQKAKSLYCLPLRVGKRLYAFISLIDTVHSLAPSPLEKQLYRNIAAQASAVIEKRQLLEAAERTRIESKEETRVLQRLNKLIATANTATSEAPILQETSEALLEVTGVDHVGIVLLEGERGFVVSEAPAKNILGFEVESGEGSIANLVRAIRKPLVVANVEDDSQLPIEARNVLKELGIEAVLIIPMFDLDGNLLGTVGLDYYSKQNQINPVTVELAETFVNQVALSLQKLRLLANSQQQAQQLQQVTNFGQALGAHLSVPDILNTALQYSNDLLEADYVGILIYEGQLLRRAGVLWNDKFTVNLQGEIMDEESDNIAIKATQSHELVRVDELQSHWVWKHPLDKQIQTILVSPLLSAGKLLGVLEVGNEKLRAYNAVDIAAFQQMGNQLAIALSNAGAYAQSQRLARNKSLANEIIAKLQRQADVGEILQVTVQELGEALGAKRGRIRLGTGDKTTK